jgi:hypothetical protein
MEFNFDDLKKEFDELKSKKEDSCDIGCDIADEEPEGFIETTQKFMLAPAKCGVYFSRLDIKVIGLKFGEDVQVRERKRMLRDILRAVTSKEELERLFDIINETAKEKIAIYDELSSYFPHSKEIFEEKKRKYSEFLNIQKKILEDFEVLG